MPKTNIKNKRHVAHLEQVARQTRAIKIGSIIIIALVLAVVIYGAIIDPAIQPYRPVASVNGVWVRVADFQAEGKIQRLQLVNQYNQYLQYAQMFGIADPANDQNFAPAIQKIEAQIEPLTLGQAVLDTVIDNQLIRQEAKKRNITVSTQEVDEELQAGLGYFPNGSPTPTLTSAPVIEPTLNATELALITITPTPGTITPTITPTLDPSITPTITFTPTATVTAGPSPTPPATLTPMPTSTPLTLQGYQEQLKTEVAGLNKEAHLSESEFRSYYENQIYRRKLEEAVVADLKPIEEMVWARHILVATEAEALQVLARLQKGEDFGKIAAEVSLDTSSGPKGGDLGWLAKGSTIAEFQDAVFAMKVGETSSKPVQSAAGYHIIQVIGHENRAVSGDDFQKYKDQTFLDFLKKLREASKVEEYDLWKDVIPTEPVLPTPAAPQGQVPTGP
jgi:parvulin-like peptidyl-prolyl isomerase